jgi:hypothetical protein
VNPIIRAYEQLFHVVLFGPSHGPGAAGPRPVPEPVIDRAGQGRVMTIAPTAKRTAPAAVPTVGTRNQ